jgi:phospholipid/cholesterol/gamma-HCH transport system substrate-binding protein
VKGQTLGAAVKLLIFAVVTILATAILGVVISNRTFGKTHTYHAVFSDVTDLITGNDVRLAGVRVGTVKSIKTYPVTVNGTTEQYAMVGFSVDNDVPITTATQIEVNYLNLVGQRYLNLVAGQDVAGTATTQLANDVIGCQADLSYDSKAMCQVQNPARTAPAIDLTELFNGFKPLYQGLSPAEVNSFSAEIIHTLQGEGGTVQDLLTQSASLTNTVAKRDAVIGQVIDNLLSVLSTIQHRNAGLNDTIVQLQRFVTGLAGDRNQISSSLTNIDKLARSSTTLVSGIRPYLPSDLKSLAKLAKSLNTTKDASNKKENALAAFLQREPAKLNRIIRTATYGGYFNFWACQIGVTGLPAALVPAASQSPSCPAAS